MKSNHVRDEQVEPETCGGENECNAILNQYACEVRELVVFPVDPRDKHKE